MSRVIWIGYTTQYREGGSQFARAAATLAENKRRAFAATGQRVVCIAVERKGDFLRAMDSIAAQGDVLEELHFIGHSGMYGIMFGSTAWPEQFSPHEWRTMRPPVDRSTRAYFHCCRSARWFAPFIARTFGITTHGYHWYTTLSTRPDAFAWEHFSSKTDAPLYVISGIGKKSHGLIGAALKHARLSKIEPMKSFTPTTLQGQESYDRIAPLYDAAFADIRVRHAEWQWIRRHLPVANAGGLTVLDIGCGNGALLSALQDRLTRGVGIDLSKGMIEQARRRNGHLPQLSFQAVDGPFIPMEGGSCDVVISFMSFRYLDWDPLMTEIRRVIKPGGRLLIVDMVAAPLKLRDTLAALRSKLNTARIKFDNPGFSNALQRLVQTPAWQEMLKYNPIRAEHEYRWYLESRFPPARLEVLNTGWDAKLVAFDTGPVTANTPIAPLSYP